MRIGLIGCGRVVERFYLPVLARLRDARVTAVADPLAERRELVASRFPGARACASAEELLERGDLDATMIASPAATHAALTALALRAGVSTLVEKPLATSLAEAERLQELARGSRAAVMVAFNRRHWEPLRRLRLELQQRPANGACSVRFVLVAGRQGWAPIQETGDVLGDLAPHQLDLLRWLFDREIASIEARWLSPHAVAMRVELTDGMVSDCLLGDNGEYRETVAVEWSGKRYCVRAGSDRLRPVSGPARALLDRADGFLRRLRGRPCALHASYERQVASFLACVRASAPPAAGIPDGVAAARAVDAARRSAELGGAAVRV